MNRRNFLGGSGALTAAAVAGGTPAAGAEGAFQLGCVTYNLLQGMDLDTLIANIEKTGLAALELRTGHKHGVEPSLGAAQRTAVRERFQKSKVKLLSYGTTCEFQSPDP